MLITSSEGVKAYSTTIKYIIIFYIHVPCKVTNLLKVVNPFTPKILLEILFTDFYAILLMFLWIIWYWINL